MRRSRIAIITSGLTAMLSIGGCVHDSASSPDPVHRWVPGPLDLYLEQVDAGIGVQTSGSGSRSELEQMVAECMRDAGFDHQPVPENGSIPSDVVPDAGLTSFDQAQEYGYGISTTSDYIAMLGLGEVARTDPNSAYRESMSAGELSAYEEALYGTAGDLVDPGTLDWRSGGCYGWAEHVVYRFDDGRVDGATISTEVARFWESVREDPRMVALDAAWAACMADEGYGGLADPSSATQWLVEEFYILYDADSGSTDTALGGRADGDAFDLFFEKEVQQAVADFQCQQDVRYDSETMRIDHALQHEFVALHRDELEAWVSEAQLGGSPGEGTSN